MAWVGGWDSGGSPQVAIPFIREIPNIQTTNQNHQFTISCPLVVSTYLKHIGQNGSFRQVGVNIKLSRQETPNSVNIKTKCNYMSDHSMWAL